jgi:hypothetical protein
MEIHGMVWDGTGWYVWVLFLNTVHHIRPVWEGVSTDSLKFHAGPPHPTLIHPEGRLLPPWIILPVRACITGESQMTDYLRRFPEEKNMLSKMT